MKQVVVVGAGASGLFCAINLAEKRPDLKVIVLEGSQQLLSKVKVSGGGRCNVTHACFDPKELATHYPRGQKELLGPFHQFMTGDTFAWFEERGVPLKIEDDNRVFPVSNSSQTIIDCFLNCATESGVEIRKSARVLAVKKNHDQYFIKTKDENILADFVLFATGSNTKIWELLEQMGHKIVTPVPSLFTFNIQDERLHKIPGVSVPNANVKVKESNLASDGPLLITHWGLSGPGILKLSSFGALKFAERNYKFSIEINWISKSIDWVFDYLLRSKKQEPKKKMSSHSLFRDIPKRLWVNLLIHSGISINSQWAQVSNDQLRDLSKTICQSEFDVDGKSTFKEEFVTAGGVDLKEVNFKRFESRIHKNMFFAGEILNIDAVTGGFNFQNAWTGAWVVASSISKST